MVFPGSLIVRNRSDFAPPHAESLPVLRQRMIPAGESTMDVAGAGPLIPGRPPG